LIGKSQGKKILSEIGLDWRHFSAFEGGNDINSETPQSG
jgi:hypothetical protein